MQPSATGQQTPVIQTNENMAASDQAAPPRIAQAVETMIVWVGSIPSLIIHTVVFIAFFAIAILHWVAWDTMFLVLTTVVSLEAIYLSIFIQFSVNRQAASLKEVEEDVESIQEDVEELEEHVEGIKEEIEEISEDAAENAAEEAAEEQRQQQQTEALEALTKDVKALLAHIEALKARQPAG
jgi:uncharacterized membrane protein